MGKLFILSLFGLSMVLDAPWGRAFQAWQPWTETIGNLFFASLTDAFGIPGAPLSIFEISSFLICGVLVFSPRNSANLRQLRQDNVGLAVLFSVPLLILIGACVGILYGNDFSTILTQTRSMVTLPLWVLIGHCVFRDIKNQRSLYAVLAMAMIFKSIQGLYYHYVFLGGVKGEREFLVEHVTSTFLAVGVFALVAWILTSGWKWRLRAFYAAFPIALLTAAFLLNDRRAALIGIAFSVLVLLFSLPRQLLARLAPITALASLTFGIFIAVTWDYRGTLGFPARTIRSLLDQEESSAGYRKVEDANLLLSVASEPLTGLGFGRRFPIVYEMPNISGIYAEFDLVPHNTLLYVWTFAGPAGMSAFGVFFVLSLGAALRLWRASPLSQAGALGGLGAMVFVSGLVFIYADLGLREVRLMTLMGVIAGGLLAMQRTGGETC